MGYIHSVSINGNTTYLIEPLLFATAGGTSSALTANISNFSLVAGAYVNLRVGEVAENATLSIIYGPGSNDHTEAKGIYYNNIAISPGLLTINNIYTFIYDGTHWNVVGDITGRDILIGTTAEWRANNTYIAPLGTVLIYTDRGTIDDNGTQRTVPGIKIGDGATYSIDAPFVGDDVRDTILAQLNTHINDNVRHVSTADRTYWDNKLDCDINGEILQLFPVSRS